jgi:uncharacterized protein YbaP (TraB family)
MMSNTRISTWLLILFTGLVLSCKSTKAAQGSGTDSLPHALLWKIEGKELKEPSYLFGTIHMIPQEHFFLPVGFDEAFEEVEEVYFEIDLDEMTDLGALMGLLTNLMMNDGISLKSLLNAQEYQEVADYFEALGLPMFMLNRVKPMFLSMLAEVNLTDADMSAEDMISYEMDLYEKAATGSKEVGGLESMAYQMAIFDSIPYQDQAYMLLDAIRSTSGDDGSFDAMVELYTTQDIEGMISLMNSEEAGIAEYEDILLHNRNRNWIPIMSDRMKLSSTLFAVGAGHLAGEDGVIQLLRKAGYTLTPVSVYREVSPRRI